MNWVAKAAGAKLLSALPGGDAAHYVVQRHVTHTLPLGRRAFRRQFVRALAHLSAYREHGPGRPLGEAVFYEFGAGWDLAVPLAYWMLGVDHQILVDIRPNVRAALVDDSVRRLRKRRRKLRRAAGRRLRDPGGPVRSTAELEPRFGIRYLAPRDARATGLAAGSIDFVSSTSTLEHVPAADLVPILAECRRLLRPDGVMSCRIDMRDHLSYVDPRRSQYGFLRHSERTWRLVNSRLLYQNRLRLPDYLAAVEEAGFDIVSLDVRSPRPRDLEELGAAAVAEPFRAYTLEELGAQAAVVVARPR